jgi:hypothetical protein
LYLFKSFFSYHSLNPQNRASFLIDEAAEAETLNIALGMLQPGEKVQTEEC